MTDIQRMLKNIRKQLKETLILVKMWCDEKTQTMSPISNNPPVYIYHLSFGGNLEEIAFQ